MDTSPSLSLPPTTYSESSVLPRRDAVSNATSLLGHRPLFCSLSDEGNAWAPSESHHLLRLLAAPGAGGAHVVTCRRGFGGCYAGFLQVLHCCIHQWVLL